MSPRERLRPHAAAIEWIAFSLAAAVMVLVVTVIFSYRPA